MPRSAARSYLRSPLGWRCGRVEGTGRREPRDGSGIMARLGLYYGLKEALAREPERWLEFGVVEHLYTEVDKDAYRELVDRYGHVAIAADTNTASRMLGRALWALKRAGDVLMKPTVPTGRWDHLSVCGAWTLPPPPDDDAVLSWAEFAECRSIRARGLRSIGPTRGTPPGATRPRRRDQHAGASSCYALRVWVGA
jgi:hypothetical protein